MALCIVSGSAPMKAGRRLIEYYFKAVGYLVNQMYTSRATLKELILLLHNLIENEQYSWILCYSVT